MTGLFVFLAIVLVLAIATIAVWLWLYLDIVDHVAALIRIKVEEQVAVWRIESIGRITQAEQRRIRDEHRPR
jgi:hypothetical protein